jgi:hydrogenase nickel insertion protein HypA
MHEYSIVQALLTQCEEHAKSNGAQKITKVVVKIGAMSGVEPYLLETAFNTFKETTVCDGAEFIMNIQPLKLRCKICHSESEIDEPLYCCSKCESLDVEVIDGEEMYLMSLEMV